MLKRVALLVVTLLTATCALALAWPEEPPDKLLLSGPGLAGEVEIVGPEKLIGLSPEAFMDFTTSPDPAAKAAPGYEMVRYYKSRDGQYEAFDRLRYHPNPQGDRGAVYYIKALGYGPGHNEGRWFAASPIGDAAMECLLDTLKVNLPQAQPPTAAQVAPPAAPPPVAPSAPQPASTATASVPWFAAFGVLSLVALVAGLRGRQWGPSA